MALSSVMCVWSSKISSLEKILELPFLVIEWGDIPFAHIGRARDLDPVILMRGIVFHCRSSVDDDAMIVHVDEII